MDEAAIRRIIREEIRTALEVLSSTAYGLDGYETDHIERVAYGAVQRSAEYASATLEHAPTCKQRTERWGSCDCGAYRR